MMMGGGGEAPVTPTQDRFVLHSSPGDGKQMVLEWGWEVTKEGGALPCNQSPGEMSSWVSGRGQVLVVSSKQKMKG